MAYCRLSDAGIYRATLEQMMYGTVTAEPETQFNDSVLKTKTKKVTDLVKKFENNVKLEDANVETLMDKESEVAGMAAARSEAKPKVQTKKVAQSTKSRSRIPSMEEFVDGILRASSPIPPAEPLVELQETPILTYRPVKKELNFALLNTAPSTDITMSHRPTWRSEGRARVAEAKACSSPKPKPAVTQELPDSAYNSPGSSASSIATTPLGSSTFAQTQDSAHSQDQEQELDVFLKLARAQLHTTIKEYSAWDPEILSTIAETGASRRHKALLKISKPCTITETMLQIYEKCISGQTTKEMDTVQIIKFQQGFLIFSSPAKTRTVAGSGKRFCRGRKDQKSLLELYYFHSTIIVSIFHLLEENVHLPRISILEEYLVMKFYKKTMQ